MKKYIWIIFLLFLFFNHVINAQDVNSKKITPLQFSLLHPYQLFSNKYNVYGLRLNFFYGVNETMYGIDLGIANHVHQIIGLQCGLVNISNTNSNSDFFPNNYGIQIALLNFNNAPYNGFQFAVVANFLSDAGIQLAPYNLSFDNFTGIQTGLINKIPRLMSSSNDGLHGLQIGGLYNYTHSLQNAIQICALLNHSDKSPYEMNYLKFGCQIGFVNIANSMKGMQISIINYSKKLNGVQIGLINIISEGALPFFPLINASFKE